MDPREILKKKKCKYELRLNHTILAVKCSGIQNVRKGKALLLGHYAFLDDDTIIFLLSTRSQHFIHSGGIPSVTVTLVILLLILNDNEDNDLTITEGIQTLIKQFLWNVHKYD